jgi:hypothetical protein
VRPILPLPTMDAKGDNRTDYSREAYNEWLWKLELKDLWRTHQSTSSLRNFVALNKSPVGDCQARRPDQTSECMDMKLMQGKLLGVQVLESYNMEVPCGQGIKNLLPKLAEKIENSKRYTIQKCQQKLRNKARSTIVEGVVRKRFGEHDKEKPI